MTGTAPLIRIPGEPAPEGVQARWIVSLDGARVRGAAAPAAGDRPERGSVLIAPGRTETVEKYLETMKELADRGFASFAIDHRGQGLSDRQVKDRRGHIDRFPLYRGDFRAGVEGFADMLPRPWMVLGHSMGGLVMLDLVMAGRMGLVAAVLCAPMTGLARVAGIRLTAASLAARLGLGGAFVPGGRSWRPPSFERNQVTRDRERYQRTVERNAIAPELGLGAPTIGWTAAARRAMKRAASETALRRIQIPVMVLSAGEDTIVNNATHARIASLVPNASHLVIEGARHEILNETDAVRARFWSAFDAFLEELGL